MHRLFTSQYNYTGAVEINFYVVVEVIGPHQQLLYGNHAFKQAPQT